jgi:hypothetical protein
MKANVSHIFGTDAKVKMMRLFIFNPTLSFDANHVMSRIKESPRVVRRELSMLQKSGLVKKRGGQAAKAKKKRGKAKSTTSRKITYALNTDYPYLHALSDFLIDAVPYTEKEISKKLSRVGTSVKLILLAGVFTHDPESRVDLLIVGDHLKKGSLVKAISEIESELGKEIRYAAFETADFKYRMSMYDKLVRDILDFPHVKILNKIGLEAAPKSHFLSTAEEIGVK